MKLYFLVVLLASFLMPLAAVPVAVVLHNKKASISHLRPRTGAFTVELGQNGVALGSNNVPEETADAIRHGLRTACPDGTAQGCTNGVGTFAGLFKKEITVTVMSAKWGGNREVYDILMDAVALLAVNGVGPVTGRKCTDNTYCTTWDRFNVTFKDGLWHMNVALENKYNVYNTHDCYKGLQNAKNVLSDLQPRMEKASDDGDVYVDATCYDPNKKSG
ncbi:hypothetical protein HBH98_021060 [Parastagonospora nodorum]|nr:hypothetical protein HBI09_005290 [Parastagonospora nodorum]KAH4229298.1 hypothetical protein HBI06_093760 [Parastagonospora nodorum]KAH4249475.1 hypothetical protein HBI05_005730 [Parastagonospora nodorum]KAH4352441.1 hypothetical protein HBH98_021060 [Parastagonospora nodorum]KAH4363400.1 hypothetical protein HBH97_184780 [Parastagonospora nodorum]